ncbi:uncharacterized protein N7473_011336 [Penicillium subrubescens]|uniref:uncharacterized protein n=1 Tax=Penicillium subrubescens TaxID=1316194 RepID=UPI00254516D3|nr:uncharacterized protein N7473_011336 [Penicillium subrubescens]KAJ5880283.1 hypothetical protein N7473_011336 [Penicillium subrubescens]
MSSPLSSNLFGSPFSAEMDSPDHHLRNLAVWCNWSSEPVDTVVVAFNVEVWCAPNSEIPVLDTSQGVTSVDFADITPYVNLEDLEWFYVLRQDWEGMSDLGSVPEVGSGLAAEQQAQGPVTPEKQSGPLTFEQDTSHATLYPGHSTGQTGPLTPSDTGSVLRNGHTPDGSSPGSRTLELFKASFLRTATVASLPDSVTDDERPYGGEKLGEKARAQLKQRKESAVSSTSIPSSFTSIPQTSSTSKHKRERSLIPRPVSVMSQARPDPTKIPLPTDSVPVLDVELRRFENSVSPGEKNSPVDHVQVEHVSLAEAVSGDTMTPLVSPSIRTSPNVSNCYASKALQTGPDVEKLSTVASAGSPCDMDLMSESVDASFGGIPTQGTFFVQPPTPPHTIVRPRLVHTNQLFQVQCPSDIKPAWYKVVVDFEIRLQTRGPRGWYELVVPGLPHLNKFDHGLFSLPMPENLGLELRTMHFISHEMFKNRLVAQFRPCNSELVIPLRPFDFHFSGFLRDFIINQTIRSKVTADKHDSSSCIVEYTAICSLDLIQRTFWAEQCGFYVYIHNGPAGDYTGHLEDPQPETKFKTIQLTSNPGSEVGMARLLVLCTPSDLDMFVIKWEMRLPLAEAGNWMPRITALPEGYEAEEALQSRYLEALEALEAAEHEQEIADNEVKSETVTPESTNVVTPEKSDGVIPEESNGTKAFMPLLMKMFLLFMAPFLLLQPVAFSIGLYDGVLRDGLGQEVRDIFCENSKLCLLKSPWEMMGLSHPKLIPPVPVAPKVTGVFVSMEDVEPVPSSVPEKIDRLPPETVRPPWTPVTCIDHIDYWLGWKGPRHPELYGDAGVECGLRVKQILGYILLW